MDSQFDQNGLLHVSDIDMIFATLAFYAVIAANFYFKLNWTMMKQLVYV